LLNFITLFVVVDQAPSSGNSSIITNQITLKLAVNSDKKYAYNVMATVEGRDPVLKNEYIVISAHLDHNGLAAPDASGDGVYNGADDDASGCVALMGMARISSPCSIPPLHAGHQLGYLDPVVDQDVVPNAGGKATASAHSKWNMH